MLSTKGFKAYDIRGVVPADMNEELAYRIGRVFVAMLNKPQVVIGHDIRLSGPSISEALSKGLREAGAQVIDIGQCGTEMIYFATAHLKAGGGIMITASHNPADYNGMKLVREGARPISADTGLKDIEAKVARDDYEKLAPKAATMGTYATYNIMPEYIEHLLTYIDVSALKPLKLVVNPGNGGAGAVVKELEGKLPYNMVKIFAEPDGHFPNGVPNPILPGNRAATTKAVLENKADVGIAWDGDFDRCFFFDEKGNFIEGYYLVGLLAQNFLTKHPGSKIIFDPRLTWNTEEIIAKYQGIPVRSKSGHAFIKERMRKDNVIYGGEMSAHHYFRDFSYCDSGMLPWLLVTELMCQSGKKLSELVEAREKLFPCSGEINRKVADPDKIFATIQDKYKDGKQDFLDGISVDYDNWRFNLRKSNTEPVVRLNVETRGDAELLKAKTTELLALIGGQPG